MSPYQSGAEVAGRVSAGGLAEARRSTSAPDHRFASGPDQAPPVGVPGADLTPAAHGGTPAVATAPAGGSLRPAGGGSGLPQGEPDGLPHPPGTRPAPIPDAPGASGASPARPTTGGRGAGGPAAAGGASPSAPAPSSSGEVAGSASASTLAQGKHTSPDDDSEGDAARAVLAQDTGEPLKGWDEGATP